MTGRRIALLSFGALLAGALGMSAPAPAQCRLCSTPTTLPTQDTNSDNVRIEIDARLDFDQIVLRDGSPGTARLQPDGTSVVSGSIGAMTGFQKSGVLETSTFVPKDWLVYRRPREAS